MYGFVVGSTLASCLVHLSLGRAVLDQALSCARHFTLTVPLSAQVYKWVPANGWTSKPSQGYPSYPFLASHLGVSRNTSGWFMLQKWAKLQPDGPCSLYADFTYLCMVVRVSDIIESMHSCVQQPCKCIGTKESVYIRKELILHKIGLVHQHGRCSIVLEH